MMKYARPPARHVSTFVYGIKTYRSKSTLMTINVLLHFRRLIVAVLLQRTPNAENQGLILVLWLKFRKLTVNNVKVKPCGLFAAKGLLILISHLYTDWNCRGCQLFSTSGQSSRHGGMRVRKKNRGECHVWMLALNDLGTSLRKWSSHFCWPPSTTIEYFVGFALK